ncbi:MAG: hypothetical protein ACYDCN_16725 [Bacteroidia bacterium]
MGTSGTSRMPKIPALLAAYLTRTNAYQLAIVPDTRQGAPVGSRVAQYVLWGWTAVESAQYTAYTTEYNLIYAEVADKKGTSTDERIDEKLLNKAIHAYDNDPLIGHHLLDKIALNGTIADCQAFGVKRGTALAVPTHGAATQRTIGSSIVSPVKVESISLHKIAHLLIQLLVIVAGQKGRAKPKGVKEIMVFMSITAIGATAPLLSTYLYVGDVKRGLLTVPQDETNEGKKAWFIARTKNTKGQLGPPSAPFSITIM